MASILLRTILHGGRQVRLYLASKGNGYQRLPEVMDKKILKEVGDRVEQEIEQFPDNTAEIEISRVWHSSGKDQRNHATATGTDNQGNHTCSCHIMSDPEQQQQYRAKTERMRLAEIEAEKGAAAAATVTGEKDEGSGDGAPSGI